MAPQHTHSRIRNNLGLAALLCAGIGALLGRAGPLNPPAGPVTGTYKTLAEIEPRIAINAANTPGDAASLFKIIQPGSYYLTGNITGVVGKHGIAIASSGVTLDLNGFDLQGVAGMGAFDGVSVTAAGPSDIAVVNGSVRGWGGEGVDLATSSGVNCRVDGVLALGNAASGISLGSGCSATNCSGSFNSGSGLTTSFGCTITACSGSFNTLRGIAASTGCKITGCTAYSNGSDGISAAFGGTVTGCTAYGNGAAGFNSDGGCTLVHCSALSNFGAGIITTFGTTVSGCTAYQNSTAGINVGSGSTVADCTARLNTLDGIRCTAACIIRGNNCPLNGNGGDGAGIHAAGAQCRIESNICTSADRGIDVDVGGNLIIRNSCAGNATNWDVVAGNSCLVVQALPGPAILGATGGAAPGSTDPNANFSY